MLFEAVSTAITGLDLQQMADRPFRSGPSVLCPVRPKQADEPIEMRPQVPRAHPREAPKAPLRPRARRRRAPRNRRAKATRRARDAGSLAPWTIFLSVRAPTRQNRRQAKNQVGARAHSLLAETVMAASGGCHRRSVLESIRLLNC